MTLPASRRIFSASLSLLFVLATPAFAAPSPSSPAGPAASAADLPDSPGAMIAAGSASSSSSDDPNSTSTDNDAQGQTRAEKLGTASTEIPLPRVKFISPGQRAPKQQVHDKIRLGLRESVTPFSMIGWAASAGWSHLIDGAPNYGVNSEAFAQRLGAAAASGVSKEIFSDSLFAPIFHQDPRYYQMGGGHKFIDRAVYAATRPVVGRSDDGRSMINFAAILGTGSSAALTQAYYPEKNLGASQVMQSWATGIGGSSLGYLISEFGGDVIQALHVKKHEHE